MTRNQLSTQTGGRRRVVWRPVVSVHDSFYSAGDAACAHTGSCLPVVPAVTWMAMSRAAPPPPPPRPPSLARSLAAVRMAVTPPVHNDDVLRGCSRRREACTRHPRAVSDMVCNVRSLLRRRRCVRRRCCVAVAWADVTASLPVPSLHGITRRPTPCAGGAVVTTLANARRGRAAAGARCVGRCVDTSSSSGRSLRRIARRHAVGHVRG